MCSNLLSFNDTVNVLSVPPIRNYLSYGRIGTALSFKAGIFANTTFHLKVCKNLSNKDRQKIALRHYQACDTVIDQARSKIKSQSDKIDLGEKAYGVYEKAIKLCLSLSKLEPAHAVKYKEMAFNFSEKVKSGVLIQAIAGEKAQQIAGIPEKLLKYERAIKTEIAFYEKNLATTSDSVKETFYRA